MKFLAGKKIILFWLGGVVFTLLVGIFFLGSSIPKEEEFEYKPTEWSQEGDYLIEETNGRTKVTNTRAGFSFWLPKGWDSEINDVDGGVFFLGFSSDKKLDENEVLREGCGFSLGVSYQDVSWRSVMGDIEGLKNTGPREYEGRREELVVVGGKEGTRALIRPTDERILQNIGTNDLIEVPFENSGVIEVVARAMPKQTEDCEVKFNEILSSFSFQ